MDAHPLSFDEVPGLEVQANCLAANRTFIAGGLNVAVIDLDSFTNQATDEFLRRTFTDDGRGIKGIAELKHRNKALARGINNPGSRGRRIPVILIGWRVVITRRVRAVVVNVRLVIALNIRARNRVRRLNSRVEGRNSATWARGSALRGNSLCRGCRCCFCDQGHGPEQPSKMRDSAR